MDRGNRPGEVGKILLNDSATPVIYYRVYGTLIVLTVVTVSTSLVDLGAWQTGIGITIAIAKASLVALFFMHLYWSSRLVRLAAATGLVWFGVLLVLTLTDYLTRGWWTY